MTLKELPIGKTATVRTVGGEGALRSTSSIWGNHSGGGSDDGKVCTDGRPCGSADSQL